MNSERLFSLALQLCDPWYVEHVTLDVERQELELHINFPRGATFTCPECGQHGRKAYDTEERTWRHLNFFEYRTTLRARYPRIDCKQCGYRPVKVPWARPGSGFTLAFEALVLLMARLMPIKAVQRLVGEHDTRLWRIVEAYVEQALEMRDDREVQRVGVDEKAYQRGHKYLTVCADLEQGRVLFVTKGRKAETIREFGQDLEAHGGDPKQITEACIDMSDAFIRGIEQSLPNAAITFDKFHVIKKLNEAVTATRREEQKEFPELKGKRYTLLKNEDHLNDEDLAFVSFLLEKKSNTRTARAVHLKMTFEEFYRCPRRAASAFLRRWCNWAVRSRVEPIKAVALTIRRHWNGVLRWFTSRITNGLLEGINSLIAAAIGKARGYSTVRYLRLVIFLIAGKLDFDSVTHLQ